MTITNIGLGSGVEPSFPADAKNDAGFIYDTTSYTGATSNGTFGIATWYMPNGGASGTSNVWPTATNQSASIQEASPFVWLQSDADCQNQLYRRNMAFVRHTSEMVMLVESNQYNWIKNTSSINPPHTLDRLASRHGNFTTALNTSGISLPLNTNRSANFAFFDGHVALFPTAPLDANYLRQSDQNSGLEFFLSNDALSQ
jgi:prepilin-type processing-associated H-X9-DG protein